MEEKNAIEKYKKVNIEFKVSIGILPAYIKERQNTEVNEKGDEPVYIPFLRENGEVEYIKIATIDAEGTFYKNREILNDSKYTDEEKAAMEKIIDSIGLDYDKVDLNKIQEQLEKAEAKTREQLEQERKEKAADTAKDDNEGKKDKEGEDENDGKSIQDDNQEKNEIAQQYNLNTNQIILLDMYDEKITSDQRFVDFVKWAKGKEKIAIIQGEDEYTWKVIGKDKETEQYAEIEEANTQPYGKNPAGEVKIQRIDEEKISDEGTDERPQERPISVHPIDSETMVAVVENNGKEEALLCRKADGKNEYIGLRIPEDSGRNVRQPEKHKRDAMTKELCSDREIGDMIQSYDVVKYLYSRGVPQGHKAGEKVNKTQGDIEQVYKMVKEDIADDLYQKSGFADKMEGAIPGKVDYMFKKFNEQADKIITLIMENGMTYEQAVEITTPDKQQEETEKDEGKVPWENSKR